MLDAAVKELVGNVMSAHWRGVSDVFVLDTHLLVYTREKRHLQLWMCDLQVRCFLVFCPRLIASGARSTAGP